MLHAFMLNMVSIQRMHDMMDWDILSADLIETLPLSAHGCGVAKVMAMMTSVELKSKTDRKNEFLMQSIVFHTACVYTCALYQRKFNAKLLNEKKNNLKEQVNEIQTPLYTVHTHVD